MDPLASFSPKTRAWFEGNFAAPTPAQALGWPAIASGKNVLIQAPTGSGKTLAAFLSGIDRLNEGPGEGLRLLYVSPLKALNYDVERNLRGPLAGIGSELRVAVRTGDTPAKERAAMLRHPPDILITTPESLYLLLTSRAREMLKSLETVILDEVHAVAGSKRGSHLALSLERLERLLGRPIQRIALSATQRPLEEIGRFVSGGRPIEVVDAGSRKQLDLSVCVPVPDMRELGQAGSIWPSIYPEIVELVRAHRSTIVFVNNRRLAERLALRINEAGEEELARAHHGSLAREQRTEIEEGLKSGELRCLVATSSLELGIDMGAVDLVIQVESPKSVARGLQRIGRAGQTLEATAKGRIFPSSAAICSRPRSLPAVSSGADRGDADPTRPLDVSASRSWPSAPRRRSPSPAARAGLPRLPLRRAIARPARERARHAGGALPPTSRRARPPSSVNCMRGIVRCTSRRAAPRRHHCSVPSLIAEPCPVSIPSTAGGARRGAVRGDGPRSQAGTGPCSAPRTGGSSKPRASAGASSPAPGVPGAVLVPEGRGSGQARGSWARLIGGPH